MAARKGRPNPRRAAMTGQEFRVLREQMDLTTEQLARLIGCSGASLRNLEASHGPSIGMSHALATLMICLLQPEVREHLTDWREEAQQILENHHRAGEAPCPSPVP